MRKLFLLIGFIALNLITVFYAKRKFDDSKDRLENAKADIQKLAEKDEIKNGDLIFQTSLSQQSKAIQEATNSKYSHCGLVLKEGNQYFVFEAVQPIKKTPLDEWISRGEKGKFVIKRLKNSEQVLTGENLQKMIKVGQEFIGKDYDLTFEWSDDKLYCSELIWKIYKRATGIEIGKLQKLKDFDLSKEVVRKKMKERYGDKIPFDEVVISPSAIFESELLKTIKAN